jgi:hypothetical protein
MLADMYVQVDNCMYSSNIYQKSAKGVYDVVVRKNVPGGEERYVFVLLV